jgi:two-component system, NtrC family, response regulator HydG
MHHDPALAKAVLDCLPDPAILLGDDYRILAANEAYRHAFGTGEEIVGRTCHETSHHSSLPCHLTGESCPLLHCRESGEPGRAMHIHHAPHGEEHEDVLVRPVVDQDGQVRAYVEIIRPLSIASAEPSIRQLVGRAPAFRHMLELVERVAPRDTTVLLLGESGTGKELVAEAVHRESRRSRRPFVPVDCSGLTETLFESELFGYEKGAFTGATSRRKGLVEAVEGGTLFLDEIGDVPLGLQVKLLRLLETGRFRRVGSTEQLRADFRLVCATHRDLEAMVAEGAFRQDLYYRINVFPIPLPPLRRRRDDVPLLVASLLERVAGGEDWQVHPEAMALLEAYDYPGNVRELLNVLERACLLADAGTILPRHLPDAVRRAAPCPDRDAEPRAGTSRGTPGEIAPSEIVPLEQAEERYLRWVVERHPGDNRQLAHDLGLSERTLYRKLQKIRGSRTA